MDEEEIIKGLLDLLSSVSADPVLSELTERAKKNGMSRERFIPWISGAISFAHSVLHINNRGLFDATLHVVLDLFDGVCDKSEIPTNVDEFLKTIS